MPSAVCRSESQAEASAEAQAFLEYSRMAWSSKRKASCWLDVLVVDGSHVVPSDGRLVFERPAFGRRVGNGACEVLARRTLGSGIRNGALRFAALAILSKILLCESGSGLVAVAGE